MDTPVFSDTSLFLSIFLTFLKERKWSILTLFGAVTIEIVSNTSARIDSLLGKDFTRWTKVRKDTNH